MCVVAVDSVGQVTVGLCNACVFFCLCASVSLRMCLMGLETGAGSCTCQRQTKVQHGCSGLNFPSPNLVSETKHDPPGPDNER